MKIGVDLGGSHIGVGLIDGINIVDSEDKILTRADRADIQKSIVNEITRMIKKRIDYFGAAPNFYWCIINPIGHFEALSGDLMHKYSIRLNQNYRLIIRPDLNNFSMEELKKCESYYIEGVVDYHGSKKNWIIP